MDPGEFLTSAKQDKRLRVHDNDRTILRKCILYDITLSCPRDRESKVYLEDDYLYENVYRGNAILVTETQTYWARRGLRKFYDAPHQDDKIAQRIYSPLRGPNVTIYETTKANGENAQISYNVDEQVWIIGSKNVTLLAQSQEDLELYGEVRFQFAKLIAEEWFEWLKNCSKLDELKHALHGRTIVGEYCGNKDHQHLVQYDRVGLHWYAIVEHTSKQICSKPSKSQTFFTEYELPHVSVIDCQMFQNCTIILSAQNDLKQTIQTIIAKVSSDSMDSRGEGVVLYLESNDDITMCKVKTLEYYLFRKLREKLRAHLSQGRPVSLMLQRFEQESIELCKYHKPPRPFEYYRQLAVFAFDLAQQLGALQNLNSYSQDNRFRAILLIF